MRWGSLASLFGLLSAVGCLTEVTRLVGRDLDAGLDGSEGYPDTGLIPDSGQPSLCEMAGGTCIPAVKGCCTVLDISGCNSSLVCCAVGVCDAGPPGPDSGGRSTISCAPSSLDFGTVSVGSTFSLPLTCNNVGDAPWSFASLGASASVFGAAVASGFSSTLGLGDNAIVDVSYTPVSTAQDEATLSILPSGGGPPAVITLTGKGATGASCNYAVTSLSVSLWNPCGAAYAGTLAVNDLGPTECLVTIMSLSCPDSGLVVRNRPATSQRLSPPDGGPYPSEVDVPYVLPCGRYQGPFSCNLQIDLGGSPIAIPIAGACCNDDGG
jgi:hypothetical protein